MKPIAEALEELMQERGMSRTDLWTAADISRSDLYRYLKGSRGRRMNSQALETVEKLARALGVEPEYFKEYRQAKAAKLVADAMADGLIELEDIELILAGKRYRETARGDKKSE